MSKVKFDGEVGSPELERITAKKNYASSMQSHKMGATLIFNMIHQYLSAEKYPALRNGANGNVAVKQLPILAFLKTLVEGTTDQYHHKYIGNFTVGADKGDKGWFGFDGDGVKARIVRLEGTDHLKGAGFNYPWMVGDVETMQYSAKHEAICVVKGNSEEDWTKVLEVSQCGDKKGVEEISAYLKEKIKPIYECAYHANPLIAGTTATLEEMNADVEAFGKNVRGDRRKYSYCEIWRDGEYDLYYINATSGKYEKNGVNLYNELSAEDKALIDAATSIEEKNRIFINHRITRAKSNDPVYGFKNHFNIDDAVYQIAILFILVASDNFEKNMYPYVIDKLMQFLQDDLDSIFPTDNQAQDTKRYSAELEDFTDETESAYVFKGEDSAFWQAMRLAYPERIQQMGRDILQAMYELSPIGSTTLEKLMGFFEEYYFGRAQEYYTKSMYNDDAEYAYEEAWNNKKYVSEVDIHPLAQSLGDHDAVERAFIEKRLVFLMSKFSFGSYSNYEDTSLGRISFRTQNPQGFTLTPAIDSYPAILGGASGAVKAQKRVMAGESVTLEGVGGGNTNVYIVGADWLSDIGDLKDLQIDPSSVVALNVSSKRLRRIKVGDENAESVTSHLATLAIQRCDSMESVDARNLVTLTGTVDLTQCPRLIQAMFGGTNVSSVLIAAGSKVEKIELPDSVTTIDLRNTKFLEDFSIGTLANVNFLRLESVPAINGFAMLRDVYNTEGQTLSNIRVIGWEYAGDANDLSMLADLANGKDDFGKRRYKGIDVDGKPTDGLPVLEGTLSIEGGVYQDDVDDVQGAFGGITINYDPLKMYVKFADPEVQRICVENWGDGTGITTEQIEAVTDIGTKFKGNTTITEFNEFEKFAGIAYLNKQNFENCTNLKSITLPTNFERFSRGGENNGGVFKNCTSLQSINLDNITSMGGNVFYNTPNLVIDAIMPNLKTFDLSTSYTQVRVFGSSGITKFVAKNLETINGYFSESASRPDETHSYGMFAYCKNLKYVDLGGKITSLPSSTFANCENLEEVVGLESVTTLGSNNFYNCKSLKSINLPNCTTIHISPSWYNHAAFMGSGIETIYAPKVTELSAGDSSYSAFKNCVNLVTVDMSLQKIAAYSFYGCTSLKNIDLSNVISLGQNAFYNCTSLEIDDLQLPNLETLGQNAFYGVKIKKISNLGKITSLPTASSSSQNFGDKSVLEEVVLPSGVTSIPNYMCMGYTNTVIIAPKTITTIGEGAFNNTGYFNDIDFPNLSTIKAYAYRNTKISKILNLGVITNIQEKTFANCSLLDLVILPETLTSITQYGFSDCGNRNIKVVLKSLTPPTMGAAPFSGTTVSTIYVPDASVTAYQEATGWVSYASRIKAISELPNDNPELYEEIKEYLVGYVANLILSPKSGAIFEKTLQLRCYYEGLPVLPEFSLVGDATITSDGLLTFNSVGEVTVTATYEGESVSRTYTYITANNQELVTVGTLIYYSNNGNKRWRYSIPNQDLTKDFTCTVEVLSGSPIKSGVGVGSNEGAWQTCYDLYDSTWVNPGNSHTIDRAKYSRGTGTLGVNFAMVSGSGDVTVDLIKQWVKFTYIQQ